MFSPISFLNSGSRHQYPGPLFSRLNRVWACRTDVEIPQLGQVFTGPVLARVIPFQPGTETVPGVVPPVCKAHLLSTPSEVFQGREKLIWKDLSAWREQEHRQWVERSRRPPMASEVPAGVWVLCQNRLAASKGCTVGQEVT